VVVAGFPPGGICFPSVLGRRVTLPLIYPHPTGKYFHPLDFLKGRDFLLTYFSPFVTLSHFTYRRLMTSTLNLELELQYKAN
jgi:hypothetical protein